MSINLLSKSLADVGYDNFQDRLKKSYEEGYNSSVSPEFTAIAHDPTLSRYEKLKRLTAKFPDLAEVLDSPKLNEKQKIVELKRRLKHAERDRKETRTAYRDALEKGRLLELKAIGLKAAFDTLTKPFKVEHPRTSRLHELYDRDLLLVVEEGHEDAETTRLKDFFTIMRDSDPQTLLIQHDWAQAFTGAHDYEGAEFRLPYPLTAFELQTHGQRFTIVAHESEHRPVGMIFYKHDDTWMNISAVLELDREITTSGDLAPAVGSLNALLRQVKAVCVALDADVVETTVERAPLALNKAREKRGKAPLRDFHVVDLSKRFRAAARTEPRNEPGTRKRLHFRRGHWRHYATHRTWIKWMLVGNPDLGFIDKEYRA